MGRTSAASKNKYNAKKYDRINLVVPKGRKADMEAFSRSNGESVNGMLNRLARDEMGIPKDEWGLQEKTGEANNQDVATVEAGAE